MKKPRKASATAFRLRDKLQALADYGIAGERSVAQAKLDALIAKYDWTSDPRKQVQKDIFAGKFQRSSYASPVLTLPALDSDITIALKWSIESQTGIPCVYRGANELWALADPSSAKRLTDVARTVSDAFRSLWAQFSRAPGIEPQDRSIFISGLADGMIRDVRTGTLLPTIPRRTAKVRTKAGALVPTGLSIHPYTVAARLGESIRFSVALEEVSNQLADAIEPKQITESTPP